MDKRTLAEFQKAGEIVTVALKPAYATLLGKRKIKPEDVNALKEIIDTARRRAAAATGKTTAKQSVTLSETDLKKALVRLLVDVRKAAKQKVTRSPDKSLLKKYGTGDKFDSSRKLLEQTATNFMTLALQDDLPGIDQEAIDKIKAALDAYMKVQTDQSDAQSSATGERSNLETAVADIAARRREIQLAADAIWPPENKANAGIRKEFFLPPNKAFKG